LYSSGNLNQCAGYTTPSKSYLRPNIQFNYCTPTSNPVPTQLSVTSNWLPSTGVPQVSDAHAINPTAAPDNTTTYSLQILDAFGCAESDSVTIHVLPSSVSALININDLFCPGSAEGTITALLNTTTDSLQYTLVNSNFSDTLYSGVVADSSISFFPNILNGVYHLLLSDSVCSNIDYAVSVTGLPAMVIASPSSNGVNCYGDSTGSARVSVSGGVPPYHYLWDSLPSMDSCVYNLTAGNHSVTIVDSNNCSQSFESFPVYSLLPILILIDYDTAYGVAVSVTGGQLGYTINWGDSSSTYSTYYAYHVYSSTGTFYIKITDQNGCEMLDSVLVLYNSINKTEEQVNCRVYPNPTNTILNIQTENFNPLFITISDVNGRKISEQKFASQIDVATLTSGIYFIELKGNDAIARKRFVKM